MPCCLPEAEGGSPGYGWRAWGWEADVGRKENGVIALDITRLVRRAHRATPSGIDRVLLEYAGWAASLPSASRQFFVVGRSGARVVAPWLVGALLHSLRRRWLGDRTACSSVMALPRHRRAVRFMFRMLESTPVDPHAVILNVGHKGLDNLHVLRTSTNRIAVMVHDLMPITSPEDFDCSLRREFWHGLVAVCEHADLVVANSGHTERQFLAFVRDAGLSPPPIVTLLLGSRRTDVRPHQRESPYFVAIGGGERRKNISFLVDVWQTLARDAHSPTLVLVTTQAPRTPVPHGVEVVAGLDDRSMLALVKGAQALLMPTTDEGFGLPLLEALQNGTPVICSDIPVLREVGGGVPEYVTPLDEAAWVAAIRAYASGGGRRDEQLQRASRMSIPTWESHFAGLRQLLSPLHRRAAEHEHVTLG